MPITSQEELNLVIAQLEGFSPSAYASGATRDRILEDRNYLIRVLDLQEQRMTLDQTLDITTNPDPDTLEEAVKLQAPANLRIENGFIKWDAVDHAVRYELIASENGIDDIISVNGTSYSLIDLMPGDYQFTVKAIGDGFFYESSNPSSLINYEIISTQLATPTNVRVEDGIVKFDAVYGALSYRLVVNYSDFTLTTTSFDLSPYNLAPGTYQITVQALGNGNAILDSEVSEKYYYVIERILTPEETIIQEVVRVDLKEFIFSFLRRDGE